MEKLTTKLKISLIFGLKLILIGAALLISRNYIFEYCKYKLVQVQPNSLMFNKWSSNPYPLYLDFYFFNWTNPEDIFNKNIKPTFEEIGPYTFSETKEKVNVVWNDDNNTVSFNIRKTWYYNETNDALKLSQNITTTNAMNLVSSILVF